MEIVSWNEERMGRLETLYREGVSFALIADDIGVSRNAAIGKARRMNLPRRQAVVLTKMKPKSVPPPIKPPPIVRPPPPAKPLPDPHYFCSINDLEDCSCRYPLWEPNTPHPGRRYCGFPTASVSAGLPYCRRHTRVAAHRQ